MIAERVARDPRRIEIARAQITAWGERRTLCAWYVDRWLALLDGPLPVLLAKQELLVSVEADVYPKHHPDRADLIDGAIGEGSEFHETFGYYAQGVGPTTAVLPGIPLEDERKRLSARIRKEEARLQRKADRGGL